MPQPPNPVTSKTLEYQPSTSYRVFLWLVFVAVVAGGSSLASLTSGYVHGATPSLASLLYEGDGFLIAVAITADGVSRELSRSKPNGIRITACGFVLAASLFLFGLIKSDLAAHKIETLSAAAALGPSSTPQAYTDLSRLIEGPIKGAERYETISLWMLVTGFLASGAVVISKEV